METRSTTEDSLFAGRVICRQNKLGYRFSVDSVLAAHFPGVKREESLLDLGCGCGIISLILMYRWKNRHPLVTGLELQPSLAVLARENVQANRWGDFISIVQGDLKEVKNIFPAEQFSQVICNPPFYNTERGRASTNEEAYLARHQVAASLEDVAVASRYCLKNKGKFIVVFPSEGSAELLFVMKNHGLEPKRVQYVYSRKGTQEAKLVLIEAVKNGGSGVKVLPPFYIYDGPGREYSEEMEELYSL